jgi:hypothetical protein
VELIRTSEPLSSGALAWSNAGSIASEDSQKIS